MPEFLSLVTPDQATSLLFQTIEPEVKVETVPTNQALNKVIAEDILSPHDLPEFRRSTVDGYAVIAKETHGASPSLPTYLGLSGEVPMGNVPTFSISGRKCALIHTGGMLPDGADAVVMLEDTQVFETDEIEVYRSVAQGENVIQVAEDISSGEIVIPRGRRLRPAEIGGLMSLGITSLKVAKPPVFGIISNIFTFFLSIFINSPVSFLKLMGFKPMSRDSNSRILDR